MLVNHEPIDSALVARKFLRHEQRRTIGFHLLIRINRFETEKKFLGMENGTIVYCTNESFELDDD